MLITGALGRCPQLPRRAQRSGVDHGTVGAVRSSDFSDMPWLDPPLVPRIVSRGEALRLGFTARMIDHRLATGSWRRLLPSVYLTVDTLTWLDRQHAALAFGGRHALLSGAAALCDANLRSVQRPGTLLVLVPTSVRRRSAGFVQLRPTARTPDRELAPGPARACYPRAVADLARSRRQLDDVRALVAEAVRRRLCTVDELALELAAGARNGSAHLRQALDEVGGNAWSAPEARAARLLRRAGVPAFEQNARLDLPDGRWCYPDFLWRDLRAVLEIDSAEFHQHNPRDADATDDRHIKLETFGYSVVHRRPAMINREPEKFVRGIAGWLAARAAEVARRAR